MAGGWLTRLRGLLPNRNGKAPKQSTTDDTIERAAENWSSAIDSSSHGVEEHLPSKHADREIKSVIPRTRAQLRADLGIDFGTRFTKVVMYLPHIDIRVPLILGEGKTALHPARLAIHDNIVFPPDCLPNHPDTTWINYLKMRLANADSSSFDDGVKWPRKEIAAFSAFYLAGVLRLAQRAAVRSGRIRSYNDVRWFAQLGVPVKTYDSPALSKFEEVADVAWIWKDNEPNPISIMDLTARYEEARRLRPERGESPIVVSPELMAAIYHIAFRPDAPEGIYALLDIGAGTLDGTVFELKRTPSPAIDILAAEVEPLGTIPVAKSITTGPAGVSNAEERVVTGGLTELDERLLRPLEARVSGVLRKVIAQAVNKRPNLEFVTLESGLDKHLKSRTYKSISVLLAGGGGRSRWYCGVFERLDMHNWIVARFVPKIIPRPTGWTDDEYPRLVVANGLSSRDLQLRGNYRFPGDIPMPPQLPDWKPPTDSPASKDAV